MKIRSLSLDQLVLLMGIFLPILFSIVGISMIIHRAKPQTLSLQEAKLPVPTTQQLAVLLNSNSSTDFWLSDLIETNFLSNSAFSGLLEQEHIDNLKAKIALKITNFALTQTTLNAEEAFLGLIANAYDAMLTSQAPTHHYGVGFLLSLSFLTLHETKGAKIIIDTIYRNDDLGLTAYTMLLTCSKHPIKKTNDVQITITPFSQKTAVSQTGTTIAIMPTSHGHRFGATLLKRISDYIMPLSPEIPLLITHSSSQEIRGDCPIIPVSGIENNISQRKDAIEIILQPEKLEIVDWGTGISLETALTKLFIPWQSTKQSRA